jgi:hypothetical protein
VASCFDNERRNRMAPRIFKADRNCTALKSHATPPN